MQKKLNLKATIQLMGGKQNIGSFMELALTNSFSLSPTPKVPCRLTHLDIPTTSMLFQLAAALASYY